MSRQPELTGIQVKRIYVAAGVLRDDRGRVLITERLSDSPFTGLWEFPGGKINVGESPADALQRELVEELGIRIESHRHLISVEHQYEDRLVALEFYLVDAWLGEPAGRQGQRLRWESPDALDSAMLLPADAPVVDALKSIPCLFAD